MQLFYQMSWVFATKLWIYYPCIYATQCQRPLIFQTRNSFKSDNKSLKYLRSSTLSCKDIGIWKSEFVAKTQFLYTFFTIQKQFHTWAFSWIDIFNFKFIFSFLNFLKRPFKNKSPPYLSLTSWSVLCPVSC